MDREVRRATDHRIAESDASGQRAGARAAGLKSTVVNKATVTVGSGNTWGGPNVKDKDHWGSRGKLRWQ